MQIKDKQKTNLKTNLNKSNSHQRTIAHLDSDVEKVI